MQASLLLFQVFKWEAVVLAYYKLEAIKIFFISDGYSLELPQQNMTPASILKLTLQRQCMENDLLTLLITWGYVDCDSHMARLKSIV